MVRVYQFLFYLTDTDIFISMISNEFQDYYDGIIETITNSVGSESYARNLGKNNYFRIKTGFYEDENPETITNELLLTVKESINESNIINEAKGINEPIRRIVRDITNIVKSENYGEYFLPEDITETNEIEYDFDNDFKKLNISRSYNIPSFSIELTYNADYSIKEPYMINGALMSDGDTISVLIIINPEHYPSLMYDLIADINDVVAHEIEHIFQENYMRPDSEIHHSYGEEQPSGKDYYKQSHEIPAELKGIIRVAKLRNQPIKQVIGDWFKRSQYAHQLNDKDSLELISFLSDEYEKRYGI